MYSKQWVCGKNGFNMTAEPHISIKAREGERMKNLKRIAILGLALALTVSFMAGCSNASGNNTQDTWVPDWEGGGENESVEMIEDDLVPLAGEPAISTVLMPAASGTVVKKNAKAEIDASNTKDGYVMIRYLAGGSPKLKVIITGPSGTAYTYNLRNDAAYEVFPLSDGNGKYKIGVYKNVSGTKYSTEYSVTLDVTLTDEFAPFVRPNQYVNYTPESRTVKLGKELTAGCIDTLSKIKAVYSYVVENISYDKELAANVQSGYVPNVDAVLEKKTGICFDYAAVMAAMLRSQNIPVKLVVGYTGTIYHAWISAYSPEDGWIDGVIFFNGKSWKLMDPTFASSGNSSKQIMDYISKDSNYQAKYLY